MILDATSLDLFCKLKVSTGRSDEREITVERHSLRQNIV